MIGKAGHGETHMMAAPQESRLLEVIDSDQAAGNLEHEVAEAASMFQIDSPTFGSFERVRQVTLAEVRPFSCQDYEFGYAVCSNCHNDQAYYVHHTDLVDGYTFRCRVCRLEMTVWAKS
jgi:hypothetical protein